MKAALRDLVVMGVVGTVSALAACNGGGSSSGGGGGSAGEGGTAGAGGSTAGTGGGVSGSSGTGGHEPVAGAVGKPCSKNGDCDSGVCQTTGRCTAPCNDPSDCPAGPTWICAPVVGHGMQCQCTQVSGETCDGFDQDCDAIADNGATCSQAGYSCVNGTCECVNKCNGVCTDLQTDNANCGTCGNACTGDQACEAGTCTTPTCSPACGPLEQCGTAGGQSQCVAKLVTVTGGYAIDATEVTRSQYQTWLSTNPSSSGQPSYCYWNASFVPTCEWQPPAKSGHPVVCVDWCDAYAYCQAVGKRLCGRIGGGANAYADFANATKSQWFNVCSSGGQNDYPYGDSFNGQACYGSQTVVGWTVEAGSLSTCQSSTVGYAGVYDLSGNAWEWEDSCSGDSGITDYCRLRGGPSYGNYYYLRCGFDSYRSRDADGLDAGFRCCAP